MMNKFLYQIQIVVWPKKRIKLVKGTVSQNSTAGHARQLLRQSDTVLSPNKVVRLLLKNVPKLHWDPEKQNMFRNNLCSLSIETGAQMQTQSEDKGGHRCFEMYKKIINVTPFFYTCNKNSLSKKIFKEGKKKKGSGG